MNQQDEKDFQVSCQQVEPGYKTCRICGQTLERSFFPSKGQGRLESQCKDCHNANRRARYLRKLKPQSVSIKVVTPQFNEKHEGLNDLLDLICSDILRKEVGS